MKKTGKILLSAIAAGAAVSAAAFMAKKNGGGCQKPASDVNPEDGFWEDGEYFPEPEEESAAAGNDGPAPLAVHGEEKPAAHGHGICLTADEAGFLRYILDGIGNVLFLTDCRIADIGKLARKRKITNTDRIREIRNACEGWDSDRELLEQCVNDVREVLEGGFPEDLLEYISCGQTGSGAAPS